MTQSNRKYKFIRYGGLSPVNQKGYTTKNMSIHQPPARKGIYAFPYNKIETFLINMQKPCGAPSNYAQYVKDKDGNPIVGTWNMWTKSELDIFNKSKEFSKISRSRRRFQQLSRQSSFAKWKNYNAVRYRNDDNYDYDFIEENFEGMYFLELKKPKRFKYSGNIWCHLNIFCDIDEGDIIESKFEWIKLSMNNYLKYLKIAEHINYKEFKEDGIKTTNDYFEVFIEHVK